MEFTEDKKMMDASRDYVGVILSHANVSQKVFYDLALLKKRDKVYYAYKIPATERILAFCKDNIPLIPITMGGIVFTDQAAYCCPPAKSEKGNEYSRFAYSSLDSCLITQNGPKEGVYVHTRDDELCLVTPTLVAQNMAGCEIRQILCKVQRQLLLRDSNAKDRFDSLASGLLDKIRNQMGIDALPDKTIGILDCLLEFPEYADKAALLKAECLFREFRPEKYIKFAATLPFYVSWEVQADIKRGPSTFADRYIQLLTDVDREFEYNVLTAIDNRISNLEKADRTLDIIQAYLCIRMKEYERSSDRISEVRRKYGAEIGNRLQLFRCTFFYHEMFKVYKAIKNGGTYPKVYLKLRDGVGLTPLHYAIILKNEKTIKHLLGQRDWKVASPYGSTEPSFQMYDYSIPAAGNQLPNIQDILLGTHAETIKLRDTAKTIRHRLEFQNAVHWLQDTNLYAHRMDYGKKKAHHASKEELHRISENIDAIKEQLNVAEEHAAELTEMLCECEESIVYVMEDAVDEAMRFLEDIRNENLPLANYLHRLYFEPDFFERVLLAIRENQDLRLYHYKNFYFVAPGFVTIDLPYCGQKMTEDKRKKETQSEAKPPYGNSWFSNEAHHNIDTLKSEYHRLVKEYHPDVCNLPKSNHRFQEISAEYKNICQSILRG